MRLWGEYSYVLALNFGARSTYFELFAVVVVHGYVRGPGTLLHSVLVGVC